MAMLQSHGSATKHWCGCIMSMGGPDAVLAHRGSQASRLGDTDTGLRVDRWKEPCGGEPLPSESGRYRIQGRQYLQGRHTTPSGFKEAAPLQATDRAPGGMAAFPCC